MRRRTLLSASLGVGSLVGWASIGRADAEGLGPTLQLDSTRAFGTTVTVKVRHADAAVARSALQAALQAVRSVDALMSLHQPASQLFALNDRGRLDRPHPHLVQVLRHASQLSQATDGAFDVTVQPLWQAFASAQAQHQLPTPLQRAAARAQVNWRHVEVSDSHVRLARQGMAVTLNGLAQGYATDLAMQALRRQGVGHALLDTGEFGALGDKPGGQPWVLGIRHPRHTDELAARVALDGRCLATSGDYETAFSADRVHHHIFDPATGDSATHLASATVVAPSGLLADGLSTAFMVLAPERSLALLAHWPGVDALLIGKDGQQHVSPGFPLLRA